MSRYKLGYATQAKHDSFGRNEEAAHQQARFLLGKSLIPGPGLKQRVCAHPQLVVPPSLLILGIHRNGLSVRSEMDDLFVILGLGTLKVAPRVQACRKCRA